GSPDSHRGGTEHTSPGNSASGEFLERLCPLFFRRVKSKGNSGRSRSRQVQPSRELRQRHKQSVPSPTLSDVAQPSKKNHATGQVYYIITSSRILGKWSCRCNRCTSLWPRCTWSPSS